MPYPDANTVPDSPGRPPWLEDFLTELRLGVDPSAGGDPTALLAPLTELFAELVACPSTRAGQLSLLAVARRLGHDFAQAGREFGLAPEQLVVLASHSPALFSPHLPPSGEGAAEAAAWPEAFLEGATSGVVRLETMALHKKLREANRYILQERRRYYSIFKRMTEPAFIIDHDLRLLETNRAFDHFFKLSGRSHIGRNCYAVLGTEFQAGCDLNAFLLSQQGGIPRVEVRLNVGDELRTVLVNGTFLGDINHEATGGIVILQDVTARRAVESALRESERQYRSLVENVPDVAWRFNAEGELVFISPNAEGIYGYTPAELLGKNSVRLLRIHPDDAEMVDREFAAFFASHLPAGLVRGRGGRLAVGPAGHHPYDVTFRFQKADGTWAWIRERACHLEEQGGQCFADGVSSDVTPLKTAEEELERHNLHLEEMVLARTIELRTANQQLKKEIAVRRQTEQSLVDLTTRLATSNRELDQFAHVASHDLKEPLMLIAAFSERLAKRHGGLLDAKGQEYIERIAAAACRMRQLIDGLLALSQVTSSARPYEEIDLEDLVREVLDSLEERINESRARIEVGKLGRLGGDRVQIRQLFQNIIANALKYRKSEGEPLVILRGNMLDGDRYEILIQDNGIGFAPEDAERIFRPLERLHSRREYEGTGMGLTTCQKIVARHGGEIFARGRPGQGATFVIRLPVALRQDESIEED